MVNCRLATDSEVLARLIGKVYDDAIAQKSDGGNSHEKSCLVSAVRSALQQVIGTSGIASTRADIPNFVVGARRGSPLVLGVGKDENFLASDVSAMSRLHARRHLSRRLRYCPQSERDKFEISSLGGGNRHSPSQQS